MMEGIEIVAPTAPAEEPPAPASDDVQSLGSDDSASVESSNNSGRRRGIVKLAIAGLAVAAVAAVTVGLGVGLSNRGKNSASTSASQFKVNANVGSMYCEGEMGSVTSAGGKVRLAAFQSQWRRLPDLKEASDPRRRLPE